MNNFSQRRGEMTFDEWWEKVNNTYDSDSPSFPNYRDCWEAAQAAARSPSDAKVNDA